MGLGAEQGASLRRRQPTLSRTPYFLFGREAAVMTLRWRLRRLRGVLYNPAVLSVAAQQRVRMTALKCGSLERGSYVGMPKRVFTACLQDGKSRCAGTTDAASESRISLLVMPSRKEENGEAVN